MGSEFLGRKRSATPISIMASRFSTNPIPAFMEKKMGSEFLGRRKRAINAE